MNETPTEAAASTTMEQQPQTNSPAASSSAPVRSEIIRESTTFTHCSSKRRLRANDFQFDTDLDSVFLDDNTEEEDENNILTEYVANKQRVSLSPFVLADQAHKAKQIPKMAPSFQIETCRPDKEPQHQQINLLSTSPEERERQLRSVSSPDNESDCLDATPSPTTSVPQKEYETDQIDSVHHQPSGMMVESKDEGNDILSLVLDDNDSIAQQPPPTLSQSRIEERNDILSMDDDGDDVLETAISSRQDMLELTQERQRTVAQDQPNSEGNDLLTLDSDSVTETDPLGGELVKRSNNTQNERECDIIDLEQEEENGCQHKLAEDNTSEQQLRKDDSATHLSSDQYQKLVELRRRREDDAMQCATTLANQNTQIAAKLMGDNNSTAATDREEEKLRTYRQQNTSASISRQAELADRNNQMAHKIVDTLSALSNDNETMTSKPRGEPGSTPQALYDIESGVETLTKQADEDVVALPVDCSDLPAALEYDATVKPHIIRNRRFRLYAGLVAVMVLAMITVAWALFHTRNKVHYEALVYRETIGIKETLEAVFGNETFSDKNSQHSKALQWIVHDDKMEIEPHEPGFVQRFLAAAFYFATADRFAWGGPCGPAIGYNPPNECELTNSAIPLPTFRRSGMRWLSGEPVCTWLGMLCDELGQVRKLELSSLNITTSLPQDIAVYFPSIQDIRLQNNMLVGNLSDIYFERPRHLTNIVLNHNLLTGTIPLAWFESTNLIRLLLSDNQLTGALTPEIFLRGRALKHFAANQNNLSGQVPEGISPHGLFILELRDNELSGHLPQDIGRLGVLDVGDNNISGNIPLEWSNSTFLHDVLLGQNLLTGSIPEELFSAPRLQTLDVQSNQLNGVLSPSSLPLPETMLWLNVENNNFTGTIPEIWASSPAILVARFDQNALSGSMPFCPSIRETFNRTSLRLVSAVCNPDLQCDCCETSCDVRLGPASKCNGLNSDSPDCDPLDR